MSDDIRETFWKAMAASPFVMIRLEDGGAHALPMTAQLDRQAHGAIWFYAGKDNRLAPGGRAMAQFAAKGHDLFACIAGTIATETDPAIIDKHWSNQVEAWFEGGRNDPDLLMLRFDIDDAEIWTAEMGPKGLFKLMTGKTIEPGEAGRHEEVALS
jgi:general stress protein 26